MCSRMLLMGLIKGKVRSSCLSPVMIFIMKDVCDFFCLFFSQLKERHFSCRRSPSATQGDE